MLEFICGGALLEADVCILLTASSGLPERYVPFCANRLFGVSVFPHLCTPLMAGGLGQLPT